MARITVEDCLKRAPNRFMLVNMVAKRVRQIREGSEYLVSSPKNEDIVVALREIAAGKVNQTMVGEFPTPNVEKASAASGVETTDVTEAKAKAKTKAKAEVEVEVETEAEVEVEAETEAEAEADAETEAEADAETEAEAEAEPAAGVDASEGDVAESTEEPAA